MNTHHPPGWVGIALTLSILGQFACAAADQICGCHRLTTSIALILMVAMCYLAERFHESDR